MSLTLKKPKTKTILTVLLCLAITILSFCLYWQFLKTKHYYSVSDHFYYYSIAENLHENGAFADATADPDGPIITPQNGVVAFLWTLQLLPLSRESILILVAWIHYLLIFTSLYPLFKIADYMGLKNRYAKIALAIPILIQLTYLKTATYAVNDGIFRPGSLWLIYFFFLCYKKYCSKETVHYWKIKFAMGLILSATLVHFRIDTILIVVSFALAALLVREYKLFSFISVFLIATIISLVGFYFCMQSSDSEFMEYSHERMGMAQSHLFKSMQSFYSYLLPITMHKQPNRHPHIYCLLCGSFYLSVFIALFKGYTKKNFGELALSFIVLSTTSMIIVHGAMNERYLLGILPILYLLMLIRKKFRIIGYLFIFVVLFSSVQAIYKNNIHTHPRVQFWTYVSEEIKLENDNTFFISQRTRTAWYFTEIKVFTQNDFSSVGTRTYNYPFDRLLNADHVYLAGPKSFLEEQKGKIQNYSKQKLYNVNFKLLTPDYDDKIGRALYQIELTPAE